MDLELFCPQHGILSPSNLAVWGMLYESLKLSFYRLWAFLGPYVS